MIEANLISFDEMTCADGKAGLITFQNAKSLNALTLEMFDDLHAKLLEWKARKDIKLVILRSSLEKAFCAGGDVKALAKKAIEYPASDLPEKFFRSEYSTDFLVHQYSKPILCWLDGITMGGGVGISNGASHRVVTERTQMAMPELNIGFFPDVGAAYFLNQLPESMALFLAWTGTPLTGSDAVHLKLADICLPSRTINGILNIITETSWSNNNEENHWMLSDLLSGSTHEAVGSPILKYHEKILRLLQAPNIEQAFAKLVTWNHDDPWVRDRVQFATRASPLSVHVTYQHLKNCRGLSIGEVLVKDWSLAVNLVRNGDFKEGIRAALIDKDHKPKWKHESFSDVPSQEVEALLQPAEGETEFKSLIKKLE
jgi:enoyl-CoA hydratase/carnithine racemase